MCAVEPELNSAKKYSLTFSIRQANFCNGSHATSSIVGCLEFIMQFYHFIIHLPILPLLHFKYTYTLYMTLISLHHTLELHSHYFTILQARLFFHWIEHRWLYQRQWFCSENIQLFKGEFNQYIKKILTNSVAIIKLSLSFPAMISLLVHYFCWL